MPRPLRVTARPDTGRRNRKDWLPASRGGASHELVVELVSPKARSDTLQAGSGREKGRTAVVVIGGKEGKMAKNVLAFTCWRADNASRASRIRGSRTEGDAHITQML
jgi:hypothetical protein